VTGGLLTPCATAVTCAVPVVPGVQTVGTVRESQVPAHAKPFSATVTTAGLLDWNEKVSASVVPALFLAVAVRDWVFPNSKDTFGDGARETDPGTWFGTMCVGLLLPQPASKMHPKTPNARVAPDASLPMGPFGSKHKLCWKTLSVESESFFGNLRNAESRHFPGSIKM